jgi:hypothetical protein
MEVIEKYPDKPWDWGRISRNPNITMEMIEKTPINHGSGLYFNEWINIPIKYGIGNGFHKIKA